MHPDLTFDLIQQDHRERIETARALSLRASLRAARRASGRPDRTPRGRAPARHQRPRGAR